MKNYQETVDHFVSELAKVSDGLLPELTIRDNPDGSRTAWVGGRGYGIGKARRKGQVDPSVHVTMSIDDLFHAEAVRRLEVREADAGRTPSDIKTGGA